jgi:hypothetical protein
VGGKVTREGQLRDGKGGVGKGGGGVGKGLLGGGKNKQLKGKGKAKEAGDAMDGELWTTRMPTSKRRHSLHPSQSIIISM